MTLSEGIQGNVTQHYYILYYDTLKNIAQHFVMMIAAFFICYAVYYYAECHITECHYVGNYTELSISFIFLQYSVVNMPSVIILVIMRSVIVLTVILLPSHHYADCQYTECRYANCRYANCRYTECSSTIKHCYTCLIILIKVRFYPTCAQCYETFYVRNFKCS
jgi:hypothetical protein